MDKENIRRKRLSTLSLLDYNYRGKPNEVYVESDESRAHVLKKTEICERLKELGKEFITSGIFKNGMRCDILVLDDCVAIEVVDSEKEDSIDFKKKKYPCPISVCKVGQNFEEKMLY